MVYFMFKLKNKLKFKNFYGKGKKLTNFPVAENLYNIKYTNFSEFGKNINDKRMSLYTCDKDLLIDNGIIIENYNFKNIQTGRFQVKTEVVDFDCLYKDNNQEKLYVILSAGVSDNTVLPNFQRWSYHSFLDGNVLCVADPMYKEYKDKKLCVGWYYGTSSISYLEHLKNVIDEFAKQNKISLKNIVFVGSSSSGYAAIYLASKLPTTNCLAINPQIKLSFFPYYNEFVKITGMNPESDSFNREDISDLMINNNTSNFVLVESCKSPSDMAQMEHICKKLETSFYYGLQKLKNNLTILGYDTGINPNVHKFVETKTIMWVLTNLVDEAKTSQIEHLKNKYMAFCELWTEIANLYQQIEIEKSKK